MDIGLYNLAWLVGLFGEPQSVHYEANIERGIDTSGIMTLDYGTFRAVSVAAKDCSAPWRYVIQGTEGYQTFGGHVSDGEVLWPSDDCRRC